LIVGLVLDAFADLLFLPQSQHPAITSGTPPLAELESYSAFFLHGTQYVMFYLRTGLIQRNKQEYRRFD